MSDFPSTRRGFKILAFLLKARNHRGVRRLLRIALYLYALLIACPVRYWPLVDGLDPTWVFALNLAASQGPVAAGKVVFTAGPLSYLTYPMNLGHNLTHGLLYQAALWIILAVIFADIFFWFDFRLRNLLLFSFWFTFASPLFLAGSTGTEVQLTAVLTLLVTVHLRGGSWVRYLAALTLVGLLPLFKLSGAMIGLMALTGFLAEQLIRRRSKALGEVAIGAVVPAAIAATTYSLVKPSFESVLYALRGSAEIIGGYSATVGIAGPPMQVISAFEAVAVLAVLVGFQAAANPGIARFYAMFLAIPLFLSFKEGFVRQDGHVYYFFGFVALALALVSLTATLDRTGARRIAGLAVVFFVLWQDNVSPLSIRDLIIPVSARVSAGMLGGMLRFDGLKQRLNASIDAFPERARLEPELVRAIGDAPVASLSANFTNVAAARLRLQLYPVIQRYSAYTPYLDRLNAAWIRDQGPRFLVFDGLAIDGRDAWAETPAMWLEVYRWYDARILGSRNLLLERRAAPRFTALETIARFRMPFTGELRFPASSGAIFWTMECGYGWRGQLQKLLFRVPATYISIYETGGSMRQPRIVPEVLGSPVLGNYLPGSLPEFYIVFQPDAAGAAWVDKVRMKTFRSWSYSADCDVEILRPAR